MTTVLILLTPVVLLAIVALFAFVGCSFQPGRAGGPVIPPVVAMGRANENTLTGTLTNLGDNELVVATLLWSGPATPTPKFTGVNLYPASTVNNGKAISWNGMNIQVFMNNVDQPGDGSVPVTVTLPAPSPTPWSLCMWAYRTLAKDPVYGGVFTDPNFVGVEIKTPEPITLSQLDCLYAVAFAADPPTTAGGSGAFPGTNSLSAPVAWGFSEYHANSNPVLIGFVAEAGGTGTVTPLAINKPTDPKNTNPRGFMVAVGIRQG